MGYTELQYSLLTIFGRNTNSIITMTTNNIANMMFNNIECGSIKYIKPIIDGMIAGFHALTQCKNIDERLQLTFMHKTIILTKIIEKLANSKPTATPKISYCAPIYRHIRVNIT